MVGLCWHGDKENGSKCFRKLRRECKFCSLLCVNMERMMVDDEDVTRKRNQTFFRRIRFHNISTL